MMRAATCSIYTDCSLIKRKNLIWQVTGDNGTRSLFDESLCGDLGAIHYVSAASYQDFQDIGDLCDSCYTKHTDFDVEAWIGIELDADTCHNDSNFVLRWTDGSFMNYDYIKWCNGYPNNICINTSIYLDCGNSSNYCLGNGPVGVTRFGICDNPTHC